MATDWDALIKKAKKKDAQAYQKLVKDTQQRKTSSSTAQKAITAPERKTTTSKTVTAPTVTTGKKRGSGLVSRMDELPSPVKKYTPPVPAAKSKEKNDRTWFKPSSYLADGSRDKGDITKAILGTVVDAGEHIVTSVPRMAETGLDALAMIGTAMSKADTAKANFNMVSSPFAVTKKGSEYARGLADMNTVLQKEQQKNTADFVKKDIIDEEAVAKKIIGAPFEKRTGINVDEATVLGDKSGSAIQSAGQMLTSIGLQAAGVPMPLTMGLSAFGSQSEKALNEGATFEQAAMSAAVSAGAEVLSEYLSGGIKVKLPGQAASQTLDDILIKPFTEEISNKVLKSLANIGIDAVGEGFEEIFSGVVSNLGEALYKEENIGELIGSKEALDEYIESFIAGMALGGGSSTVNAVAGRNNIELSENEQKVFDSVVEDRIAEETKDGKKLTKSEERKIRKAVLNDMLKGAIDTDTIESVLGGEDYKAYKDAEDNETAIQKEFDSLNKMKQGEMTGEQIDRRAELKQQLEEIKSNSTVNSLKTKMSDNVSALVKDSRLSESYNEKARRRQSFEADLTKYNAKQQETVKKAVESGILNNTRKTHDFVDMIAKISADKGVSFDFTSNQKLKESGFAIEGKTVNGYITKDGIKINVNSAKALNSVAGHEITHIFEGTELYSELQTMLKAVAESKGEYQARYDEISKLYEGIEGADIEKELTADLVGDYIFTDSDFISRLSAEKPGVFKKLFDEIKYLCRVAASDSKEAKELEKVKRVFETAYKESVDVKNTADEGGVIRYSLMNDVAFEDNVKDVINMADDVALKKKEQGNFIRVMNNTPSVILDNVKDAGNYEVIIRFDALYLASRKDGVLEGHYHNLGEDIIKKLPEFIENPDAIVRMNNGRLNLFTTIKTPKGNNGIISMEMNTVKDINSKYNKYNLVVSVFSAKDNYTRNNLYKNGKNVEYKKEDLSQVNPQLYEWLTIINDKSSIDSIPNSTENVKQDGSFSLSAENTAPKKHGDYNIYGEDVMLEGETKSTSKREFTAPTRENIAEKKKAKKDKLFPMLDDDIPIEKDFNPPKNEQVEMDVAEPAESTEEKPTRAKYHASIVENIKTKFSEKGFDLDKVLSEAKNLSTFSTVDNTPQRVMEKALGYKPGQILADATVNKVAQNESEGIKWLNSFTDRKNGILAEISKKYNIKPGSKESAAAQMYAEGFYVNEKNEIIKYGEDELIKDFPDVNVRERIKGLANDEQIRQIYDETLEAINAARSRNLYPEIQRLDNYFLHFRAMEDTFSRLGLPFNPNDIRAKDLPTDLNGVTADLKPGQPYFASAKHREGKRTTFDLLGGLERYLTSAKNQIYHIDDIQNLRALRNYIADTFGQAKGLGNLDSLSEEEAQERIEQVYGSHLSTFAKFLNEEANVLAGKTTLIDRGLEGIIGRRGISFLNTVNGQVGSNMVGFNISSSLTNILPVVQTAAKTNKGDFVKALAQTAFDRLNSLKGKSDGFKENSPVIIRRKGADRFYRTPYQKFGDAGYILMSAVDDVSTEIIARTKYNELTRKGMDSQQAHFETDKWVSRLMGDRSLGQMPQLYNSKLLGVVTKFQLEVRNQLDSMFYDTVQEAKVSNEEIENRLKRNAKTAAKVSKTFFELAVLQHGFGWAFEQVAGYNPAFDIIEVLIKTFGLDDDEDDEDTVLDNIEEGFFALLEDLPYTSTLTGGRIPISSALPINEFINGKDQYGNEKSRGKTLADAVPYYLLPTGFGQIKKTAKGLKMFDKDLPIAGSYTDSGNLRFPVEKTPGNILQAAVLGQYANKNAQSYFDEGYAPLKEKQIQEFKDIGIPIADYWKYREGLSGLKTLNEKGDYIGSLDLPTEKKNILINNIADRKTPIDMSDYDKFPDFEVFDFAKKNPELYKVLQKEGISVREYKEKHEKNTFMRTDDFSWAATNPEKYTLSRAVTDSVTSYRDITSGLYDIRADKDKYGKSISGSAKRKKKEYIWSLDIDEGAKCILFRNEYKSDDTYNGAIINYLNGRNDISYEDKKTILTELDFKIDDKGRITWD